MKRFILLWLWSLGVLVWAWHGVHTAEAACGSVTCFVVVGSQQQVPQAGILTFNTMYNYTPMRLLDGTNGVIPAIDQAGRRLILDHHQEVRTITQTVNCDLNYGITDRLGIQVTIPYLWRTHKHLDGLGEAGPNGNGELVPFRDNGVGDVTFTAKDNVLPMLRNMVVAGFGVQVPTGTTTARADHGEIMESPGQLGRGHVGLIGSLKAHGIEPAPDRGRQSTWKDFPQAHWHVLDSVDLPPQGRAAAGSERRRAGTRRRGVRA